VKRRERVQARKMLQKGGQYSLGNGVEQMLKTRFEWVMLRGWEITMCMGFYLVYFAAKRTILTLTGS
jgi:hypothetical protein